MSKNNRIQQPYGYREQNKFTSETNMICDAISAGGSDKDIIKQLVEKLNIIFSKAFVNAQYNKDNEEFEFRNYYDAEVGNVEFPFIVKDALQKSKNNYLLEKNLLNEPLLYTEIITTILKLNILMIVQKFV